MGIKFEKTCRGFSFGVFNDLYGKQISIQDSSLATDNAIWLGPDDAEPKRLVLGQGWQPVPFPPNTDFVTRMHINQDQAAELIEVLQRFVETGSVTPSTTPVKESSGKQPD